jgi:hypothetical protein
MSKKVNRKPNTACLICNCAIYKRPAEIRKNFGRVFCSKACYGKACGKETPCLVCGKLILARENKKTCSMSCSNKNRLGVKCKGGRPKDKVSTQRILKKRVIDKRGNQCERCDYDRHKILVIHHINRTRKDNSFKNLELLCPNCHAIEHYAKDKND